MSLEAALEEERREIMNILEGRPTIYRETFNGQTSSSGQSSGVRSSAPPVRSMLDIDDSPAPKHAPSSVAQAHGTSNQAVRSMLDIDTPEPTRGDSKTPSSLQSPNTPGSGLHWTSASDSRPHKSNNREGVDPNTAYRFSMLPSIQNQALPKRVTQGGKKSIAPIMQGHDLNSSQRGRDSGRHHTMASLGGGSKSPSSRAFNRSQSPGIGLTPGWVPESGKYVTESGKVIDMSTAYRKLNEAALLNAGGALSNKPTNTPTGSSTTGKGELLSASGEPRLQKDHYPTEGDEDEDGESSEEGEHIDGSGDELWSPAATRGRRRGREHQETEGANIGTDGREVDSRDTEGMVGLGKTSGPRKPRSLLAAAEEERVEVTSRQKVKSMLDDLVPAPGPSGERMAGKKSGVHPNTNYDQTYSPTASDNEEISDIKHAQRLNIDCSPIDSSVPDRASRIIIRGDFPGKQREAADGSKRLRTYLVATDLSSEAAYALEWTIGTVLRDGDTLLAVFAVDEEVGTGKAGEAESTRGLPTGEDPDSSREVSTMVEKMNLAVPSNPSARASQIALESRRDSSRTSADSRNALKPHQERLRAVEGITQTCIKYLRKTKLQVRVGVEVIHCKSPKHMITEAIDGLEPTLVVLGSRGRSALKGVLLGSFSNYLVTKSSVPVMVARKRLSGRKKKQASPAVTLTNNLRATNVPFSWAPIKVD